MPINTLSPATMSELQQMLRWWRQFAKPGVLGLIQPDKEIHDRHVRWARTTTDAAFPAYPTSPVDVIACELGEYTFVNTAVADVSATFAPYNPREIRYVFFPHGWQAEGSIVRITLHDGKWFAFGAAAPCDFIRFEILATGINALSIRWAQVEVLSRPVGCDEVEEESAVQIDKVYDMAGCFLNEPADDLVGRIGYAKYLQDIRFIASELETGGPIPDPAWEIISLCCPTCDAPPTAASQSSSGQPAAMITGSGPGPIPGQFLP